MIVDADYFKDNVFQIWRRNGERLPFKVRRWSWRPGTYAVVTGVKIGKYPYGKATWYLVRSGKRIVVREGSWDCLGCAGCYQWHFEGDGDDELFI